MTSVFEKDFLNFYFLKVYISLVMYNPNLKFYTYVKNIAVEGTVSQIFDTCPGSFSIKFRKKNRKKYLKNYPFFDIK